MNLKKGIWRYLIKGFITILIIMFGLSWFDLVGNKMLSGNLFKDIWLSITYYIGWLPTWWLIILIGSIILSFLFYLIHVIFIKLKALI